MLIWQGWGLLGLLIPLFGSWSAQYLLDHRYGEGFYLASLWAMPLVFALAALPTALLGHYLSRKPIRRLLDLDTGETLELKPDHSLFWIPLRYWAFIQIAISGWFYASNIGLIYA